MRGDGAASERTGWRFSAFPARVTLPARRIYQYRRNVAICARSTGLVSEAGFRMNG